jgi:membrane-bound lytic murein transglycosylase D
LEVGFDNRQWVVIACLCVSVLLFLPKGEGALASPSVTFPLPKVLRPNVAFWKQIFTEFDSDSGLLHDATDVTIVYHVLRDLPRHPRKRQRLVDRYRRRYKRILQRLAQGKRRRLSRDERRVLALFKGRQNRRAFRAAAYNIRFQQGLRDRFIRGLQRSGAYLPTIRRIFATAGLPTALALLPHVESSFNNAAFSKYGAAGIWQFTRSTGRRFLRIDSAIDERFDFRRATAAAAKLLRKNYQELGTWPLAITAYNHGVSGMKRAIAAVGTRDFGTIIRRYRSRTFGFASRNFYAEFLATMDIVSHHDTYFPGLTFDTPLVYHTLKLDAYVDIRTLATYLGVKRQEIARWNPALRRSVLRSQRLIPKGFVVYIPRHRLGSEEVQARWARIPASEKFPRQLRDRKYRIRPGDTLSTIARRFRTTVEALMELNDIDQPNLIKAGRLLRLPQYRRRRVASSRPGSTKPSVAVSPPDSSTFAPDVVPSGGSDSHLAFHLLMAGFSPKDLRVPEAEEWLRVHKGTIRVVATETLGLYAEWLEIPVRRLRALNHLSPRRPLSVGARLRLDFSRVSEALFTRRRLQYHRRIEENFFRTYAVDGVITHTLKRGETLWTLARREYDVPLWLLQKYNYDLEFRMLSPGTKLRIPQVVEKAS